MNISVSINELKSLIGEKEILIYSQNLLINELQNQIKELKDKYEPEKKEELNGENS